MSNVDLGMYDGRPIIMTSIVIPGAGGGLRDALTVAPVELHTGDEVDVLLRCVVGSHKHDPIKVKNEDTGNFNLVYTLDVARGIILEDKSIGDKHLESLSKRVERQRADREKAARAAAGEHPLPGTDEV